MTVYERLNGKNFCITGTLKVTRNEAVRYIENIYNAHFKSSVSSVVKVLIVGNNPGRTKMDATDRWNAEMIPASKVGLSL